MNTVDSEWLRTQSVVVQHSLHPRLNQALRREVGYGGDEFWRPGENRKFWQWSVECPAIGLGTSLLAQHDALVDFTKTEFFVQPRSRRVAAHHLQFHQADAVGSHLFQ